ncbi:MAG: helix-turn-helix transcriptional regulator [Hyphomicrobiales bacterium]|nr:helix-turn-helix transcriptional regulator [Hyphomicrobiales bacterium]
MSAEGAKSGEIRDLADRPCDAGCPVRATADIVGYKWTTLIVRDLLSGKKRYSQLQRSVSGISPRVLAERLKQLEEAGLVEKRIFATVPPTTEYELTALGRELEGVIAAMAAFGAKLTARGGAELA